MLNLQSYISWIHNILLHLLPLLSKYMANNTIVHGWQDQPNSRGTFDILKTCIGTIFLLCWSSVCPNVPSSRRTFTGNLELFLLAIIGPDFVFITALGQLNLAWRAKKALRQEGYAEWSLRHCFFVNMGGVHLDFRDRKLAGLSSFPVDCEQLLHLVQHKYMDMPEISKDDIKDRNKADGLVRAITIVQTLWFTTNVLGRIAQGLFITTLELTTLGFALLMVFCSIFWWRKPMDVTRPVVFFVNADLSTVLQESHAPNVPHADLSTVLQESHAPNVPHGRTPLSYLNQQQWYATQFWSHYTQILRNMKLLPPSSVNVAEADSFPSIDFPEPDLKWNIYLYWLILAYSAIFMAAWNFTFPTTVERLLWRISAGICVISTSGSVVFVILRSVLTRTLQNQSIVKDYYHTALNFMGLKKRGNLQATQDGNNNTPKRSSLATQFYHASQWFDWMRNLSPDQDPTLAIRARLWLPTTLLCIIYCLSRAYILVEDVIGLRSLPQSAFQTVDWGQYSPIL